MEWNSRPGGARFSGSGASAASRSALLDGARLAGSLLPARCGVGVGFFGCAAGSGGGDVGCGSAGCGVSSTFASVFSSGPDIRGVISGCG